MKIAPKLNELASSDVMCSLGLHSVRSYPNSLQCITLLTKPKDLSKRCSANPFLGGPEVSESVRSAGATTKACNVITTSEVEVRVRDKTLHTTPPSTLLVSVVVGTASKRAVQGSAWNLPGVRSHR